MHRKTLITTTAAVMAYGLVACGGGSRNDDTPVAVGDTIALTASGRILSFDRAAPGTLVGSVAVSGLATGETLLALDMRPATGDLYALSSTGALYVINPSTGAATIRTPLVADGTDASDPFASLVIGSGGSVGMDFNPTVDRLRVVTSAGQNLRINVDTGATLTDGPLSLAGGADVGAAAYTNSFDGATATQLWVLNRLDDRLYLQNPPNDGVLANPVTLGATVGAAASFDIEAAGNGGYAAFTMGSTSTLYTIDLNAAADAATAVGTIAGGEAVIGLALADAPRVATAFGLTGTNQLVRFNPRTPGTIDATTAITGLATGETVVGIDFRPANDLLYALTDAATLYTVDPASGAATLVAALADNAAMPGAGGAYAGLAGTRFSVDFNPVADRLRVISEVGQSLRINVDNGLTIVDGAINRASGAASVVAAAYTNSFTPSPRTPPPGTQLFNLETNDDSLTLQDPPNDGTLTNVGAGLGFAIGAAGGFDIAGSRNGLVLATLGDVVGPHTLYQVNLATGVAALPRGLSADTARVGGAGGPALLDIALRF